MNKNRSFPASHTHEPMLLMQGWPWVAGLSWLTSTNKGLPFSETVRVEFTKSVLCQSYKQKIPIQAKSFILSVKLDPSICFVHWQTCPHPNLNLEYLCVFYGVDRNAVMKLCSTFQCILTWESPWREVCVNVWYVCTMLGSLFRKDWACSVCILEMSSWSCGGTVTMEAEMNTMWTWHRTY